MKSKCQFLVLAMIGWALTVSAQGGYEIKVNEFKIDGSSNVHNWESSVTKVNGKGELVVENNVLKSIKNLNVTIPVKGIKSSKGSIMDNKTYDALKEDKNPNITYQLIKVTGIEKKGDGYEVNTQGTLTIAGASRTVDITVTGKPGVGGSWQFTGSKKLKMTDFKINPPTALMGTMKTGDDITVSFNISLLKEDKI